MHSSSDNITLDIDLAVQELLAAPSDKRLAMVKEIAGSATRKVVQGKIPKSGFSKVSTQVAHFVARVCQRLAEANRVTTTTTKEGVGIISSGFY